MEWIITLGIIFVYLFFVLFIGIFASRGRESSVVEFTAASRSLNFLVMYFLMGGAIFSAFAYLGGPGWAYSKGAPSFYILAYCALGLLPWWIWGPLALRAGQKFHFVTQAQLFAARFQSKALLNHSVVTVGSFRAGSTFNIIPGEAHLSGTTRTFDKKIWNSWPERIEKVVHSVCQSMNADFELDYKKGYPPTVNDAFMTEKLARCAEKVVGKDNVVEPESTMGGEDMTFFLERSRGCNFFPGIGREGSVSLHNPRFDFNEDLLLIGVEIYCRLALEMLGSVC